MKRLISNTNAAVVEALLAARQRLIYDPPDVDLDNDVTYNRGWALLVPHEAGVYLIRDLRGCLYVGKTCDLRRRFDQHLELSHNPKLVRALAHPVGDLRFGWILNEEPDLLEQSLIRSLQPLCNDRFYLSNN